VEGGVDLFWGSWGSGKYPRKIEKNIDVVDGGGGGLCPLQCIGGVGGEAWRGLVVTKTTAGFLAGTAAAAWYFCDSGAC